ncbi:hypothetical protein ACIPSE_22845 [Streptomyces sp. NPDC090106]|uniref:hypothetical protein n=1 Tax=Streptomyces sp. NPDC090106 TaxID=3365946 RepID=UPI00381EFA00
MADERRDAPIPRDPPDQQAHEGDDPWDLSPSTDEDAHEHADEGGREDGGDPAVPETDEAGTARQGDSGSANVHPEHPGPDESPG